MDASAFQAFIRIIGTQIQNVNQGQKQETGRGQYDEETDYTRLRQNMRNKRRTRGESQMSRTVNIKQKGSVQIGG